MVGVVDLGWTCAAGPAKSSAIGDLGAERAAAGHAMVAAAGEVQLVRVSPTAIGPIR